jgi:hypothetical protein
MRSTVSGIFPRLPRFPATDARTFWACVGPCFTGFAAAQALAREMLTRVDGDVSLNSHPLDCGCAGIKCQKLPERQVGGWNQSGDTSVNSPMVPVSIQRFRGSARSSRPPPGRPGAHTAGGGGQRRLRRVMSRRIPGQETPEPGRSRRNPVRRCGRPGNYSVDDEDNQVA